mgnify:CR=1 FL=1
MISYTAIERLEQLASQAEKSHGRVRLYSESLTQLVDFERTLEKIGSDSSDFKNVDFSLLRHRLVKLRKTHKLRGGGGKATLGVELSEILRIFLEKSNKD